MLARDCERIRAPVTNDSTSYFGVFLPMTFSCTGPFHSDTFPSELRREFLLGAAVQKS